MWFFSRLVFIAFWAFCGWTDNSTSVNLSPWDHVFFALGGALGVRHWVMRNYTRKSRTDKWLLPSWKVSPFQREQPLQFLHMCGISFVVLALSGLRHSLADRGSGYLPSMQLCAGSFGIGILIGIYWSTKSYRTRFSAAT